LAVNGVDREHSTSSQVKSGPVNVSLDAEHALKLQLLAERTQTDEGTLARTLLSSALDDADPNPRDITALLDGITGAFERALLGREQAHAGLGVPLGES
jgi:hypothetical protein